MNFLNYESFIKNRFSGKIVHIIGSGPSLTDFDYSIFKNKTIITINHSYKLVESEFTVCLDTNFAIREDQSKILDSNKIILTAKTSNLSRERTYQFRPTNRFSLNPEDGVYSSRSSGLAALTIALQGMAERIFLWGFDYKFFSVDDIKKYTNVVNMENKMYGHSTSGVYTHSQDEEIHEHIFTDIIPYFSVYPRNKIINMSIGSAIPFFEKRAKI